MQETLPRPGAPRATDYQWPADEFYVSERYRAVYCPIPKVACSSLKLWWAEIHRGTHRHYVSRDDRGFPVIEHENLDHDFRLFGALSHLGREPLWSDDWFRFVFVRNPWSRLVSAFINKFVAWQPQAEPVYAHFHSRWRAAAWQRLWKPTSPPLGDEGGKAPRESLLPLLRGPRAWRQHFTFRHFVEYLTTIELDDFGEVPVDIHWMPQYRFLGENSFHFVGRIERLAEDFAEVAERLGAEKSLTSYNRSIYAPPSRSQPTNVADWPLHRFRSVDECPNYRAFYTPQLVRTVGDLYRRDVEQFGYDF
jgi:hypothetical protein